ncbi:integrase family protein [Citrifermentans bemidjiense Bem]|uniref:Integrase family protein n=1 Tax=Citrifermentans bemidjiense (strain ATCC BAA-1014 / DSM 16622 / JCM 12645 / Bem) TaxID=404380 RepID=B5EA59_CITBB|nr:site-specific integrase [Citrifermentans bemidjiense]ACH38765.1 integrase family protein [Citrifermentans bemidjiense Bem]
MANYLRLRNQNYYLRIRIPADLPGISTSAEILKSLRTRDLKSARLSAASLLPQFLGVFTLTRCGFITPIQASERLCSLLGSKKEISSTIPAQAESNLVEPKIAAPPPSPSIASIIQEYVNDNKSAWTGKTLLEYGSYWRLLQDVLEVDTVAEVTREEVRKLRDTLCRLPANLYKKHPGKTIKEVLALEGITPMSTTTVNKLLTLFGSLMIHCVKEGYRRDNPTEGLKVKQKKRADEERKAYTREDLKKMVAALPSPSAKPERYWVPLIGMYSGMRLGEICGLHVSDVRQVDGVWVFDVNEEADKRLKTEASKRLVPIHPKLIGLGLLRYVETMKERKSVRMWPKLVRRDSDGYCAAVGNWFGRFNRKHVTEDPLKSFHSLRHAFADTLKQLGVQENLIAELMGHANDSITTGRYGKRYQPKVLLEALSTMCYQP